MKRKALTDQVQKRFRCVLHEQVDEPLAKYPMVQFDDVGVIERQMEVAFLLNEPNVTEFRIAGQRLMILHIDSFDTDKASQFSVLQKESPKQMKEKESLFT